MTVAEELLSIGYTGDQIVQGLREIGGYHSLGGTMGGVVSILRERFNTTCAPDLGDLQESVATLLAGEKSSRSKAQITAGQAAIEQAKTILAAGTKAKDGILALKDVVVDEAALAQKLGANSAFQEYRKFMLATLLLVMNTGRNVESIKTYLDGLSEKVKDAAATGAATGASTSALSGYKHGATGAIIPLGGRVSAGSADRIAAMQTALMAGDVKYLAMLDMVDVNLSQADRVAVAQLYASSGDSLRDFESNVHKSLGGRAVGALRDVGLL
jgi:hypothetical protein